MLKCWHKWDEASISWEIFCRQRSWRNSWKPWRLSSRVEHLTTLTTRSSRFKQIILVSETLLLCRKSTPLLLKYPERRRKKKLLTAIFLKFIGHWFVIFWESIEFLQKRHSKAYAQQPNGSLINSCPLKVFCVTHQPKEVVVAITFLDIRYKAFEFLWFCTRG